MIDPSQATPVHPTPPPVVEAISLEFKAIAAPSAPALPTASSSAPAPGATQRVPTPEKKQAATPEKPKPKSNWNFYDPEEDKKKAAEKEAAKAKVDKEGSADKAVAETTAASVFLYFHLI